MAKYGVRLKLDVSKIIKEHLFRGQKGTYLDATVFIDVDNKDQYDNNGMITQSWKDQGKGEGPILGNAQVFWSDGQSAQPAQRNAQYADGPAPTAVDFEDDIPFHPIVMFY